MSKSSEIRGTWKHKLAGKAVTVLIRTLGLTLRSRLDDPHGLAHNTEPVIWIFWHNCVISAPINKVNFSAKVPASALASASKDGAMIEGMVSNLARRLDDDPDNLEGWMRLVRSYVVLGEVNKATDAVMKAKTYFQDDEASLQQLSALVNELSLEPTR